ncbi:MAG: hypothetical protein ABIQ15_11160 [Nocardioides sp.]
MTRRTARATAAALVGLLLAVSMTTLAGAAPAETGNAPGGVDKDGYSATRALTRVFTNPDGSTYEFPPNTVTVTADHTQDLRGRQRITIGWSGAQPSAGRASNPYGENGLQQEYPVVILQCRGTDDPALPVAEQLSPSTCWTASVAQRSQIARGDAEAAWVHDLDAPVEAKARLFGVAPFPGADLCPGADADPYFTHLTPYAAHNGTVFPACNAVQMPPEAAVGAAFPPNEVAAFTDLDGTGAVQFEIRSEVENESLGCSDQVACSIVVVPINGLSCDQPAEPATIADEACRRGGRFEPGSSNFANQGVDQAVSPVLWWSASNWKNRFSIPITMGLPPDTCDVLDPRPPTGFYGSELLAQAALQWSPSYCLDKKRFKFQLNQMSDDAGFSLMESGGGPAAVVSSEHKTEGADPVGYAPTAVTGFAVGYVIDRPDNAGEYGQLRLNARLIAKLLTQSYLGSDLGRGHPGIAGNPLAIMNDPEFIELNPGLSLITQEAGATVLSLSNSSDVMDQLTDYLAHDKTAMEWIDGKPDQWGMKVNPAYKKIKLPRPEWPLLDEFVPQTENVCRQENPAVYFTQLAAPVTTMRKIAEALLDAWPNVQTRCEFDQSTQLYKLGRIDRQSFGARFMLGLISLGDAQRYGLRAAALETAKGEYVAPSDGSLKAAVALSEQKKETGPFVLDQATVRREAGAYPGTMVVYTAALLRNLAQEDADKIAQFVEVSTTEGQEQGTGNGELPAGFVPILEQGPTKKLYQAAQDVAAAIKAQTPAPSEAPSPDGPATPTPVIPDVDPDDLGGAGTPTTDTPAAPTPTDEPTAKPTDKQTDKQPDKKADRSTDGATTPAVDAAPMPPTQAVSSGLAGGLLPGLLLLGLFGMAIASVLRLLARGGGRP